MKTQTLKNLLALANSASTVSRDWRSGRMSGLNSFPEAFEGMLKELEHELHEQVNLIMADMHGIHRLER